MNKVWLAVLIFALSVILGGVGGFYIGRQQVTVPSSDSRLTPETAELFQKLFVDNEAVTTWLLFGSGEVISVDAKSRSVTIQQGEDQLTLLIGEDAVITSITDSATGAGAILSISDLRIGDNVSYTGSPTTSVTGYDVAVQGLNRLP